jgi:hypothetical protein
LSRRTTWWKQPIQQEPAVNDPAAGQGQIGLGRVQLQVGLLQRTGIVVEQGVLVEDLQSGQSSLLIRA